MRRPFYPDVEPVGGPSGGRLPKDAPKGMSSDPPFFREAIL